MKRGRSAVTSSKASQAMGIHRLDLQRLHEALRLRIVVGVAAPTHRADEAMVGKELAVDLGRVLRATVGVVYASRGRFPGTEGGLECRQRESGVERAADRIPDHPARPGGGGGGEVEGSRRER